MIETIVFILVSGAVYEVLAAFLALVDTQLQLHMLVEEETGPSS